MAKKSNSLGRIIVSLIFILLGASSVVTVIKSILSLELGAILGCVVGVITFITGILGLLKLNVKLCRILAVIVFIVAAVNFVMAIAAGSILVIATWFQLAIAILAWYFIIWIKRS